MARKTPDKGFPPIAGPDARWIVLGSMPGVASLTAGEYYAHPRNAFWPIMGRLFGAGPELAYPERRSKLVAAGVAVWDVLGACRRAGSLDSAIERDSEVANDFAAFFAEQPRIGWVFFNGQKAESAFRRHVAPTINPERLEGLQQVRLPSTSPAYASLDLEAKHQAWRDALQDAGAPVQAPAS